MCDICNEETGEYLIDFHFLMLNISIAKMPAAKGVPNTAANPLLIPMINIVFRSAAFNLKIQ